MKGEGGAIVSWGGSSLSLPRACGAGVVAERFSVPRWVVPGRDWEESPAMLKRRDRIQLHGSSPPRPSLTLWACHPELFTFSGHVAEIFPNSLPSGRTIGSPDCGFGFLLW